jgi:hypothetical protein
MISLDPETIKAVAATGTFFGALAMGFKRAGLITFGKTADRRSCTTEITKVCGDHKVMKADIEVIKENSKARLAKLEKVEETLNDVKSGVDLIKGYLQGKNGFHA